MRMLGRARPGARAARWLPATTALAVLALASPAAAAPPAAPVDLTLAPAGPTTATAIAASWTVPASDPAITAARWELCPAGQPSGGDGCTHGEQRETLGEATIPTPTEGAFDLRVSLENADGVGTPTAPRRVVVDRTAPAAPTDVRWNRGAVDWQEQPGEASPIVRAHWSFCRGWFGAADVCVSGSSAQRPFALADDLAPLGPPPGYCSGWGWTLSLWLEDAAGNVDANRRGGIGAGVTPSCVPQQGPPPPGTPPTKLRATSVAIAKRIGPARGRSAKRRVTITTRVRPADAGGRVRLEVTGRHGTTKLARIRNLRLDHGRATLTVSVPKSLPRLTVRATYAGSKTHEPSTGKLVVWVPRR
jgi:hypothetical protein